MRPARVLITATTVAALVATVVPSAQADDYGNLWNILPPGTRGNVTLVDLPGVVLGGGGSTTATPTQPRNVADQLEIYDGLTRRDPASTTRGDLDQLSERAELTGQTYADTEFSAGSAGAATADSRAFCTLTWLLEVIGNDTKTAAARALLPDWLHDGAQRVDRDRDGAHEHQAAIDLFDTWWQDGDQSVAYDVMTPRLGARLARLLPATLDDRPRQGVGSSWNGVAWYGYVDTTLRSVLGKRVAAPCSRSCCGSLLTCRKTPRTSLRHAVARATAKQGVGDVRALTNDKTHDDIRSVAAGVVGVVPIDRQDRPTFPQVVEFLRHR